MGLIGSCADCDRTRNLRHKPDVPMSEQSRPSVCDECYHRREEMMHELRDDRPVPPHVDPVPEEYREEGDSA
jgi:hypothetical protein